MQCGIVCTGPLLESITLLLPPSTTEQVPVQTYPSGVVCAEPPTPQRLSCVVGAKNQQREAFKMVPGPDEDPINDGFCRVLAFTGKP